MLTVSIYGRDLASVVKVDDISYIIDYMTFSTQLHGGFGVCTIRIGGVFWSSYQYLEDRLFYRLTVRENGHVHFDGRIAQVQIEPGQVTLTCEGYYAHGNDVFLDLQYPLTTAEYAYDIVSDCIDTSDLWNTSKAYIPDTTALPTPQVNVADVDYMDDWHLTDVIEDVCKLGTSSALPLFFAIWEDRKGRLFEYPDISDASNIDWHIAERNFVGGQQGYSTSRDATKFGNTIAVIYSSGQGMRDITAEATDSASIARYGTVQKRMSIAGAAPSTAIVLRDLTIERMSEPIQSVQVLVEGSIKSVRSGMALIPVRFIRAGDVVRINIDPRAGGGTVYKRARVAFVTATNYNVRTGRMQLELESNPNTLDVIMAWFGLSGGRLI